MASKRARPTTTLCSVSSSLPPPPCAPAAPPPAPPPVPSAPPPPPLGAKGCGVDERDVQLVRVHSGGPLRSRCQPLLVRRSGKQHARRGEGGGSAPGLSPRKKPHRGTTYPQQGQCFGFSGLASKLKKVGRGGVVPGQVSVAVRSSSSSPPNQIKRGGEGGVARGAYKKEQQRGTRERESGFPFSRFIETRRRRRTTGGREYYWANEGRDERVAREIRDERGA